MQYTNADSTELMSAIGLRSRVTPSQSAPDSGAIAASIAACRDIIGSRNNGVETSTDVVDPCTSCSEVDTKCTSTEPAVCSQNSGAEAVSTVGAVPSSCHSECDSTATARDRVAAVPSCSSTSRDIGDGIDRTACVASADGSRSVVVSDSRTRVTDTVTTATVTIGSVTDSQAVVSVACSQTDSVDTSSSTASCTVPAVVAESSSSSIDCVTRTAAASCSCPDAGGASGRFVDVVGSGGDRLTEQCSVIDSGGDGDLNSSVFTADSSLEESQRHRRTHRTDASLVGCSVSQQPTISCSGSHDDVGGSSELVDSVSDEEVEKEEGEISSDDDNGDDDDNDGDHCDDVVTGGTAEQESRAIVHSICRRARELREAEITSSRNYYVQRSRSQSSFTDGGYADSSGVMGDAAHHRDSQSPTQPSPSQWDNNTPVDSTSPNQHFELSRTVNNDAATSSTQGDSYRDSYGDTVHSPASSSGDASNGSLYSCEPSGPSSTCTFFGMDLPKKKVRSYSLL